MTSQTANLEDFVTFPFRASKRFEVDERSNAWTGSYSERSEGAQYRDATKKDGELLTFQAGTKEFEMLNLQARVHKLTVPARLMEEGVAPPTAQCRDTAANLALFLAREFRIYPERLSANVEEGITLVYSNYLSDRSLVIEVYNSTEMAVLLNQGKSIISAEDIDNVDDAPLRNVVERFVEQAVSSPA